MISCFHLSIDRPRSGDALFDQASFEVESGQWAEVVGGAGAGKSVLFELLTLRAAPRGAQLIVAGRNVERLDRRRLSDLRRRIGSRAQSPRLLDDRSVMENLLVPMVARDQLDRARQRAEVVLETADIEEWRDVRAGHLSHAERMLTGLLRAVVGEPSLVVIDGGLEGLGELRARAASALRAAHQGGATIILLARRPSGQGVPDAQVLHLRGGKFYLDQPAEAS